MTDWGCLTRARPTRRDLLATLGGGFSLGVAGCSGSRSTADAGTGSDSDTGVETAVQDRTYDENALTREYDRTLPRATALARADEEANWWVYELSMAIDGYGTVYEYTPDWHPTGTAHVVQLERNEYGVVPVDITPNPEGGWYVLSKYGRCYKFESGWSQTDSAVDLPQDGDGSPGPGSFALASGPDGWWASAHRRLTLYSRDFQEIRASYSGYDDLALGEEYYNDTYGTMTVGKIRAVDVTPDDEVVLRTNLGNKIYVFADIGPTGLSSTKPSEILTPAVNPPSGYGLASEPDGKRYILRGDGRLYTYNHRWEFTGPIRRVGSGDARDRYPSDVDVE